MTKEHISRSLKFRVWDTRRKRIHAPEDIYRLNFDQGQLVGMYTWKDGVVLNPVVMQYTGLTDKSGKEIYEGDLVQLSYPEEFERKPTTHPVAWLPEWGIETSGVGGDFFIRTECWIAQFVWKPEHQLPYTGYPLGKFLLNKKLPVTVEVVGNIYENPALLVFAFIRQRLKVIQTNLLKPQILRVLGKKECETIYDIWFVVEDAYDDGLEDGIAKLIVDLIEFANEFAPQFRFDFNRVDEKSAQYFTPTVEIYRTSFHRETPLKIAVGLDLLYEKYPQHTPIIDKIKEYLRKTGLDQGDIVGLNHIAGYMHLPIFQMREVLEAGTTIGLFQKVFRLLCERGGGYAFEQSEAFSLPADLECDLCGEEHTFPPSSLSEGYRIVQNGIDSND